MHKKLFALLLALSMVLSLAVGVSAAGAASGSCGENAVWSYADGTLTISGTGPMKDYREYDWEQDQEYFFDKPWDAFSQEIRRIVIGEGITRLGNDAFTNLSNLQSVKLPSTLTEIGNFVFWGCGSLTEVELPEGLTALGQQCFFGTGLKAVEIPASVTFVDANVFDSCKALTDVYFRSDPNIPSFTTGNSIFENCTALKEIRVEEGHLALRSIDGALYFMWDSGEMALNSYPAGRENTELRIADKTVLIEQFSVYGNPYLRNVIIPDTVTKIGNNAFMGCDNLETVKFEGSAPEIQANAFWGTNVTIYYPAGDESWDARDQWTADYLVGWQGSLVWESYVPEVRTGTCGDNAVWQFKNGKLTISGTGAIYDYEPGVENTTTAPWSAFAEEITEVVIDDGITKIGQMDFRGLCELKNVTIPDSVTFIGNWAFWDCKSLEAVDLPDYLTGIGQEAFEWCSSLKTIEIPATVTFLDGGAFDFCTGLTDVYFRSDPNLPSFMTAHSLFRACRSLEQIRVEEGHIAMKSIDGVLYLYDEASGALTLTNYPLGRKDAQFRVPDGTTTVSQFSMMGAPSLETVVFPDSLTKIAYSALSGCYDLKSVRFEGSAPELEESVFLGCNLTAFYPMDDPTWAAIEGWTERYLVGGPMVGGHQGSIEWVPYDPNHIHDYSAVVTAPTCTEQGFTTYTCGCGDTYVDDYVDALGHDYTDGICSRCGAVRENPFGDVPAGAFYEEPVLWAVEKGITSGTSAGTFSPGNDCLRAQVVTFLWRAAGEPEPSSTVNPFEDVTEGDFYYKAVLWAVENGITNGSDATHFNPMGVCNRAQVVTFLHRAFGNPAVENAANPFTDVTGDTWYAAPVLWAVENGITNGLTATEFGPNSNCNRAQIVTFLYRAYT